MLRDLRSILGMIRFSHTIFALPFALLAAVMAWSAPLPNSAANVDEFTIGFQWSQLVGIIVCMVAARSAAMAFNRLADRKIDALNPRTDQRHLVTGSLTMGKVVVFTLTSVAVFVLSTLLFLPNRLPFFLALPVLAFLFAYSYTKRFTSLAHFWLGAALMLAPICTWIAIRGEIVLALPVDILPAFTIGLSVLFWVAGFDIIYACQDHAFDEQAKLHSIPVRLGIPAALKLAAASHATMLFVLLSVPWVCPHLGLGWLYGIGLTLLAGLLIVEHRLVRPDDLTRVNIAFFQVNAVVSIGLFVVVSLDLLL